MNMKLPMRPIGAKFFTGSYGTDFMRLGLDACAAGIAHAQSVAMGYGAQERRGDPCHSAPALLWIGCVLLFQPVTSSCATRYATSHPCRFPQREARSG